MHFCTMCNSYELLIFRKAMLGVLCTCASTVQYLGIQLYTAVQLVFEGNYYIQKKTMPGVGFKL